MKREQKKENRFLHWRAVVSLFLRKIGQKKRLCTDIAKFETEEDVLFIPCNHHLYLKRSEDILGYANHQKEQVLKTQGIPQPFHIWKTTGRTNDLASHGNFKCLTD